MFKNLRRSAIIAAWLLVPIVGAQESSRPPTRVSLLQLIATPERFNGQLVSVMGFLDMSREGDLLYVHQADSENVISANAIWVRRTEQVGRDREQLNMKYVKVVGTFRIGFKEQMGDPSNGIPDVQSVKVWSDPIYPLKRKIREMPGVNSKP
jgi:hypothetical protein